jgi:hypothetical protein
MSIGQGVRDEKIIWLLVRKDQRRALVFVFDFGLSIETNMAAGPRGSAPSACFWY